MRIMACIPVPRRDIVPARTRFPPSLGKFSRDLKRGKRDFPAFTIPSPHVQDRMRTYHDHLRTRPDADVGADAASTFSRDGAAMDLPKKLPKSVLRRVQDLIDENARLKAVIADLAAERADKVKIVSY